jgi:hypothetical protein
VFRSDYSLQVLTTCLFRTVFRSDYSLQVLATVPILKGQTVFISYTQPFLTTLAR